MLHTRGVYVPMVTCFSHSIRFVLFLHTIYYFVGFYYSQLNWSTLIINICAGGILSEVSKWLELIYVQGVYYNLYQGTEVGLVHLFTYWGLHFNYDLSQGGSCPTAVA